MRAKFRPILVSAAAAQLVCFATLLPASHPTHAPSREPRRLVLPSTSHMTAHSRGAHQSTSHTPARGHASAAAHTAHSGHSHKQTHPSTLHAHSGRRHTHLDPAPETTERDTAARVHAWERSQHPGSAEVSDLSEPGSPRTATLTTTVTATTPELPRVSSIEQEASTPFLIPSLRDKRGRLVVPPPIYGSHDVLVHQNLMAERDGLTRVRDDEDLLNLRRQRKLVALPETVGLHVDDRLPADRRFSRPWTAEFLNVLSHDFYASFHEPLQVNSAVRTVQIQQHLIRVNGNAAPATGDTASPHLTGQAVDIGKRGLTTTEIAWMRTYLQPLIEEGKIDVEEEFQQACFHISVYKAYQQPGHLTLAVTPPPALPSAN